MTQIYCGNNAQEPQLLAGNVVLGTRYGCMRKGIGRGMHMPYDPKFAGAYIPIDQRRVYCGNQQNLPQGYDSLGNLPQCLQKGVGIGKRKRAEKGPPRFMFFVRIILPILIFLVLSAGLFSYLYIRKPTIVTKPSGETESPEGSEPVGGTRQIDWSKFLAFYLPVSALIGILIFLFWNFRVLRRY